MLLQDDAQVIACYEFTLKSLPTAVTSVLSLRVETENSKTPVALGSLEEAVLGTALCPAGTYSKHMLRPSV